MGAPHRLRVSRAGSRTVRRWLARVVAVTVSSCLVAVVVAAVPTRGAAAAAEPGSAWRRPVDGPVVRGFVDATSAYAPGHRGVDFAAAAGTPVRAAGAGTVSFAGDVAGALHVVVLHRNGLRTSYSFLADVVVHEGDAVEGGTVVGHAGGADPDRVHGLGIVHFGLRGGDRYVDPLLLYQPRELADLVRLVPVDGGPDPGGSWAKRASAVDDAAALADEFPPPPGAAPPGTSDGDGDCGPSVPLVGGIVHAVCHGIDWAAHETVAALHAGLGILRGGGRRLRQLADALAPALDALVDELRRMTVAARSLTLESQLGKMLEDLVEVGSRFLEWTRRECSTSAAPADGTGGDGHVLMAVAGINTRTHDDGSTFRLDTDALGYADADVNYFSYAKDGGEYTEADTEGDLRAAAERLGEQMIALHAREPGRVVDLIAHSQGGVVVDYFLTHIYHASDHRFPHITTVVTLASPHEGAPLATANADLRDYGTTRHVLDGVDKVNDVVDLGVPHSDSKASRQLVEGSDFMRDLFARPIPSGIDFTSIGGTDDWVVPADRIHVPGATDVVVDVAGWSDHKHILDDPNAMQAVRAALADRPPPCTSILVGLRAAIEPVLLSRLEADSGQNIVSLLEVRKWL